ncbi:MAG: methyl-accepting chemotaxis protein [Planctomycetaceae bacterium]
MNQPKFVGGDFLRAVRTSIRSKLLLGMFVVAVIPLLVLGATVYFHAEQAVMVKAVDQLEALRTIQATRLQQHFQMLENQISTFAENRMVVEAMKDFRTSFRTVLEENEITSVELDKMRKQLRSYYASEFSDEYRKHQPNKSPNIDRMFEGLDDESIYLQYEYVRSNPNSLGRKQQLDRAGDRSTYSDQHAKFHPVIRSFQQKFGLYDVFLADLETGDVVYSCFKELDFTTSLKDGPHAKSNLGRAFAKAAAADSADFIAVLDYEPYAPSYDEAAMFLAAPIFDGGKKVGVAVFQAPIDKVSAILGERTGLGKTGETYAVGSDKLFRNDSRFVSDLQTDGRITRPTTILNKEIQVDTDAAQSALSGKSGTKSSTDYRGREVLNSWQPVTVYAGVDGNPPMTWALISKIDLVEVRQPIQRMFLTMFFIAVIGTVAVLLAGFALAASLTRQTDAITNMLGQIGIGNFDARADVLSEDELGTVAMSLNAMCDNTLSLIQTRDERDQIQFAVQKLKEEVAIIASGDLTHEAEVTDDLTGGIAESINHLIHQLRTIIGNIHEAATQVTNSANDIQKTTDRVSSGTDHQSSQIVETSSELDEMAQSIQKVSDSTEQSANVANKARENAVQGTKAVRNTIQGMERIRDQVQENAKRIKRLGESSQEVGEIVQLIGDIADRTSILALNASIQAAMAGDAGKGFAVVAEEVERLAERANHATKQIESLIKAIQSETAEAIAAMEDCTKEVVSGSKLAAEAGYTLDEIDAVSKDLAELMHSMSVTTRQQAQGAEKLSKSMGDISHVTQKTASETKHAADSVSNLASLADALQMSVSAFRLPRMKPRSSLIFDHNESVSTSPMGSLILKALK